MDVGMSGNTGAGGAAAVIETDGNAESDDEIWAELDKIDQADDAADDNQPPTGRSDFTDDNDEPGERAADGSEQSPTGIPAGAEPQSNPLWATATPEQQAELNRLMAERDQALHSQRSDRGRISALSRQINELKSAPAGPSLDDRLKTVREEYPEIAEPFVEAIKSISDEVAVFRNERQERQVIDLEQQVVKKHPNYQQRVAENIDAFDKFLSAAPPMFARIAEENDAQITSPGDVVMLMDSFEAFMARNGGQKPGNQPSPQAGGTPKPSSGRRERQMAAAVTVPSRSQVNANGGDQQAGPQDDWAYFDALDARKQKQGF